MLTKFSKSTRSTCHPQHLADLQENSRRAGRDSERGDDRINLHGKAWN